MRIVKGLILFAAIALNLSACCHKKVVKEPTPDDGNAVKKEVSKVAADRYEHFILLPNTDVTHIVVIDQEMFKQKEMTKNFRFFIYETTSKTIILEDHIILGALYWEDERNLLVKNFPGQIDDEQPMDLGYQFDVITKIKKQL